MKVVVGKGTSSEQYLVAQTSLEELSDYFFNALRRDTFKEGREGRLEFPEDDGASWEVLLYWMLKKEVPPCIEQEDEILVRCWILGDKYGIAAFQDEIMIRLLAYWQESLVSVTAFAIAADQCQPSSKLRQLLVEEAAVAFLVETFDGEFSDAIDGRGWLKDIKHALRRYQSSNKVFRGRFRRMESREKDEDPSKRPPIWKDYMVGNGPRLYWAFGRWIVLGEDLGQAQ